MAERKKAGSDRAENPAETELKSVESASKQTSEKGNKSEDGTKNTALVPVKERKSAKKEREADKQKKEKSEAGRAKELPVAAGGREVGPRSVPIRMTEEERRNLWGRLGTMLLVVAVLAVAVLIFIFRPTAYTERTRSVSFLYVPDRNVTLVVVDGEIEGDEAGYSGKLTYRADNGRGDVCAAIIGGSLYVVDGDDVLKLGDNVLDCTLSAGGDYVAWRNTAQSLFYAEADSPEDVRCASELSPSAHYCLSPDGRELFYTHKGTDGITRITLISLSGNQLIFEEDQNLTPVAVADGSAYLYYVNEAGALYVLNGETGTRTLCGDKPHDLVFNADLSQLLLRNGSESRLFVDGVQLGINDLGGSDRLEHVANHRAASLPVFMGTHCLTESLLEQYYVLHHTDSAKKLIYLTEEDDRGQMNEVAYGVDLVTVTDKYVFFLQTVAGTDPHTDLFCAEIGETETEFCYGYVSFYRANVDGSRLTYITTTGLYSGKVGNMLEWLSDYVVRDRGVDVNCDDAFYYYKTAGVLYVSDNGEKAKEVATDVDWFFVDGGTLYYGTGFADDGIGSVWANHRNSRKSEQLLDGVSAVG